MKAQRSIPSKAGMGPDTVSSKQELVRWGAGRDTAEKPSWICRSGWLAWGYKTQGWGKSQNERSSLGPAHVLWAVWSSSVCTVIGKWRHNRQNREGKWSAQGHTAPKWLPRDWNPGSSVLEFKSLTTAPECLVKCEPGHLNSRARILCHDYTQATCFCTFLIFVSAHALHTS